MKKFLLSLFVLLIGSISFAQQVNFVSTAFYNSTTCEVTIQVGLQSKSGGCGNTVAIAAVDFTLQWSSDLQLISSGFIPQNQKLDDAGYYSTVGPDSGPPQYDGAPANTGNPPNLQNKGTGNGTYKSYRINRSTDKCSNILELGCGMILPFFSAKFKIHCDSAYKYSFTYNHATNANNSNYIAEFITDSTVAPSNPNKEILIYSSKTASFDNVSGNCNGDDINKINVLTAKIDSNNFVNTYGAVLPVILDYFKGEKKHSNSIQLEWVSLLEQNTAGFVVEKSADQNNWTSIAFVEAAGNSNNRKLYQVIDKQPHAGNNYYRLKQVDTDGRFNYSETVRIIHLLTKSISLFPNPVVASTQLITKEPFKPGQVIQLIDGKGTRLKTINPTGGNRVQIEMNGLAAGLYLVQLIENGRIIESISLIKQ